MFQVRAGKHMKIDPVQTICLKTKKKQRIILWTSFAPLFIRFPRRFIYILACNATDVLSDSFASVLT